MATFNPPVQSPNAAGMATPVASPASNVAAEDRWVRRQLPHYEQEYTNMTPIIVSCCSFNVGCKKPGNATDLDKWLSQHVANDFTVPASESAKGGYPAAGAPIDIIAISLQEVDMSVSSLLKEETEAAEPWVNMLRERIGADRERSQSNGNKYYPLATKQLVGLLLCVFIRKSLMPHLHDSSLTTIATGAMGSLANKGAIGLSMLIHSSKVMLINCHLAAGQQHCEKRNQDITTILTQMTTDASDGSLVGGATAHVDPTSMGMSGSGGSPADSAQQTLGSSANLGFSSEHEDTGDLSELLPQDHDVVILMGDLNYRVEMPYETVVPLADKGDIAPLLVKDQLLNEMKNKHSPWKGFTDYTPTFPPTYRFDFGTNRYDTSEKQRIPAFTDRVLYWTKDARHGDAVRQLTNMSFPEVMSSDHKPIRMQLSISTKQVVVAERKKVVQSLFEKVKSSGLDRVATAKTSVSESSLDFGEQCYWNSHEKRTVMLTNTGDCVSVVTVARRAIDDASGGAWLRVRPGKFSITPGQSFEVTVECVLDRAALSFMSKCKPFLGTGHFSLKSFMVLTVENGPVHFVDCTVRVVPSCFGNTLDNLILMRKMPCVDAYTTTQPPPAPEVRRAMLPKELWFLCEALYHRARNKEDLFIEAAETAEVKAIMEHIDTKNTPIPESLGSVDAVAHCLLSFLRDLAIPVVPQSMQSAAISAGKIGGRTAFGFVQQLPPAHCNVFIYVVSLLRFLLRPQHGNNLDRTYVAQVFSRVLVGPSSLSPSNYRSIAELRAAQNSENEAAVGLVQALLSGDIA